MVRAKGGGRTPWVCWICPLQPPVPRDGVTDCPDPAAGGTGLLPQREPRCQAVQPVQLLRIASPKRGLPTAQTSSLPGAGGHVSHIRTLDPSPAAVGMEGPTRRTLRSSVQLLRGVRCNAGPGGQRLLWVGGKPQRNAPAGPSAPCPTPAPAPHQPLSIPACSGMPRASD